MIPRSIAILAVVALQPTLSVAQVIPAIHASYGLRSSAAAFHIERGGLHPAGPRGAAYGIKAASIESLSRVNESSTRRVGLIERILPAYVSQSADLPIIDEFDAVFFAETKVVRVRLRLRIPEKPLVSDWKSRLRDYFNYLDRDRDGFLNAFEADFAFSTRAMKQLLQTGFAYPPIGDSTRTLAHLDLDRDGQVSLDELTAYYAPVVQELVRQQFNNSVPDPLAQRLTDGLFKLFDLNKDGKLSRTELECLEELIPRLDQNEDECLSSTELVSNLYTNPLPPPRVANTRPLTGPLLIWPARTIPESIVEQVFQRYDKDKNLRISKTENPFNDVLFAALDKNGDGELTLSEVLHWRECEPDLQLQSTLAAKQSDCHWTLLPGSGGKSDSLPGILRITDTGGAAIKVGNQKLELFNFALPGLEARQNRAANRFNNIYQQADPTNRGYYTEKELVGPQFQFARIHFDVMDQNMDGRVSKAEFDAYFVMQDSFADLPVTIVHGSRVPSLFQLLDTNGDNRLSITELRAAWKNLKDLEPSGGDFITSAAMQPHGQVRFGRGNMVANGFQPMTMSAGPSTAPVWFRKMDRNTDGVISRSEFPGRSEEFEKLDTNHDNLIDLIEAEAADKRLRINAQKK